MRNLRSTAGVADGPGNRQCARVGIPALYDPPLLSMLLLIVNIALAALGLYLVAGLVFAIPFMVRGAGWLDPAALGAGWSFRLIIVPGVVMLWPFLLVRWRRGGLLPERNAHRDLAGKEPP